MKTTKVIISISISKWAKDYLKSEAQRTGMTYGDLITELLQEHKEKIAQTGYLDSNTGTK